MYLNSTSELQGEPQVHHIHLVVPQKKPIQAHLFCTLLIFDWQTQLPLFDFPVTRHSTGPSWKNGWQQTDQSVIWSCCSCSGSSVEGKSNRHPSCQPRDVNSSVSMFWTLHHIITHGTVTQPGPCCLKGVTPVAGRDAPSDGSCASSLHRDVGVNTFMITTTLLRAYLFSGPLTNKLSLPPPSRWIPTTCHSFIFSFKRRPPSNQTSKIHFFSSNYFLYLAPFI